MASAAGANGLRAQRGAGGAAPTVRRFLGERAPLELRRAADARRRARHHRRGVARPGRPGRRSACSSPRSTAARGWAWSTPGSCSRSWAAWCTRGPSSRRPSPRSPVVAVGSSADRARSCCPAWPTGSIVGTVALLEPTHAAAGARPGVRRSARASRSRAPRCTCPTRAAADLAARHRRSRRRARRVRGATCDGRRRGRAAPTVDGTPQAGDGRARRRPGWRARDAGRRRDRLALARGRPVLAVAWSSTASAPRSARSSIAVDYAKERVQFDKPIGSFQAVQHLCADMLRDARARPRRRATTRAGPPTTPTRPKRHRAATMAKAFASDAFCQLGANAIQVFGGIGFTWEHDIHLFYKRLLTLQQALRQRRPSTSRSSPHLARLRRRSGSRRVSRRQPASGPPPRAGDRRPRGLARHLAVAALAPHLRRTPRAGSRSRAAGRPTAGRRGC